MNALVRTKVIDEDDDAAEAVRPRCTTSWLRNTLTVACASKVGVAGVPSTKKTATPTPGFVACPATRASQGRR